MILVSQDIELIDGHLKMKEILVRKFSRNSKSKREAHGGEKIPYR